MRGVRGGAEGDGEMLAISNDELATKKRIGKTVKCPKCGKRHKVELGKSLAFVTCGEESYLVGIDGKRL